MTPPPPAALADAPATPLAATALTAAYLHTLADAIVAGTRQVTVAEARAMLDLTPGTPAHDALLDGARRLRAHHKGDRVHCCSILNVKAGNCSEDCTYCSQSRVSRNDAYDKSKWSPDEDIISAMRSAKDNGALALGLVAAWHGVKEGTQLDMVCKSIETMVEEGGVRPDVNLGILDSQTCADRIKAAGAKVYGHNLETARSFFSNTCKTHAFEERWKTIQFVKKSGLKLCSGGIIGLGENKDQRVEFAEQLRYIEPDMIPINFLNPLEGTALANQPVVPTDEALTTLAMLRWYLPDRNLMVAGGKEVTFGERLDEVFAAGINAIMVGNYLTTLGTSPQWWAEAAAKHGLKTIAEGEADGVTVPRDAAAGKSCDKPGGCGCHD